MTKREFLNAVIEANVNEELSAFAVAEIGKLDKRNEAKSSKPSKTAIANEPIKADIVKMLKEREEVATASEIAEALGLTTQKVSALCRQLVEGGTLTATEVKVPKKGKVKAYHIA